MADRSVELHTERMRIKPNVVLAAVLVATVLAAVIAGVLGRSGSTEPLPDGTPSAAVQAYTRAVTLGDKHAAEQFLTPALRCLDTRDLYAPSRASFTVLDSEQSADAATVTLYVMERSDAFSVWSHEEDLDLVFVDGAWLITGSPWPFYGCE